MSAVAEPSFFAQYQIDEQNNSGFDVRSDRFGRIPSRFLSFSGKNSLFLTEKAEKKPKKDKKNLPLTGSPSGTFGGFDGGFEVGWYGDWHAESFKALCAVFDRARAAADNKDYANSFCRVGRYVVQLAPTGASVGRVKYKYVLLYHGLRIYIHSAPTGTIQPVRVKIGAVPLMRHGLQRVYQLIIDILFALGFNPMEELVSRADCQIMTNEYTVQDFFEGLSGGRFVTLARGKMSCVASLSTGKLESVTISSRNVELCVYDKLAELVHCDAAYQDAFAACFGDSDGNLPSVLTRFEFRFRSEILRNFGIKTVSDLYYSARSLLQWATRTWFRVLSKPKVRGHENKARVSAMWQSVCLIYHHFFCIYGDNTIKRVKLTARHPSSEAAARLVRQAVGCLGTAVALVADTFNQVKSDFYDLAVGLIDKSFFQLQTKAQQRALDLAIVDGYYSKE